MKKFTGSFAALSLFALIFSSFAAAEHPTETAAQEVAAEPMTMEAPAAIVPVTDEMDAVKSAWSWLNANGQPELAAKLEKIVAGDKTDAVATLTEAAAAVNEADPVLAYQLEQMASDAMPIE
jgi:Skp family chaperone for outer membrane proteins